MKSLKTLMSIVIVLGTMACSSFLPETKALDGNSRIVADNPTKENVQPESQLSTGNPEKKGAGVLLFGVGLHIEPFGAIPYNFQEGKGTVSSTIGQKAGPNYYNPVFYNHHVDDIRLVADIISRHQGLMTIQAQTPFTTVTVSSGNSILSDLASEGNEIALHFHEDAHLGKNPEKLTVETWCNAMKAEIESVEKASGVNSIQYWSGGNLYPDLLAAAECAGLEINSDWKNPRTQEKDKSILGLQPWRPAGGSNGNDLSLFSQHDPAGEIIYLPDGLFANANPDGAAIAKRKMSDEEYFDYLKTSVLKSIDSIDENRVNVFHLTIHPGEFRGNDPARPFLVLEKFLTEVVDPLVAQGKIQWATFSEMADAYQTWEISHPDENPRREPLTIANERT